MTLNKNIMYDESVSVFLTVEEFIFF